MNKFPPFFYADDSIDGDYKWCKHMDNTCEYDKQYIKYCPECGEKNPDNEQV